MAGVTVPRTMATTSKPPMASSLTPPASARLPKTPLPKPLLPAVVMGMLALVVWLRRLGRGGRSGGASPRPTPSDEAPPPPRGDLPTDPAEALAVLRQEASPSAAGDRP